MRGNDADDERRGVQDGRGSTEEAPQGLARRVYPILSGRRRVVEKTPPINIYTFTTQNINLSAKNFLNFFETRLIFRRANVYIIIGGKKQEI